MSRLTPFDSSVRSVFWQRALRVALLFVLVPVILAGTIVMGLTWQRPLRSPFAALFDLERRLADDGLRRIETDWQPEYVPMILEVGHYARYQGHAEKLESLLKSKTGQSIGINPEALNNDWYRWLWKQPPLDSGRLNELRSEFYSSHPSISVNQLGEYFENRPTTLIRAEEIRWGGVFRDLIPPIRQPVIIPAADADYLHDGDVVFGIAVNGEARAYPRRILGHHEMIIDTIGDMTVTGVYCPLCQVMIPYNSRTAEGTQHVFGTSGFLYRSNKLMYDADTKSLWQTMTGEPVVGTLAGKGLVLDQIPVVTTTWGEWRINHPDTMTVSLTGLPMIKSTDHGDTTDYSEGAAYRPYFQTDEIAYHVPLTDPRLRKKAEVFVPVLNQPSRPFAISVEVLASNPIYQTTVGTETLAIFTTASGANRAYRVGDRAFHSGADDAHVVDQDGVEWAIEETELRATEREPLPRVPGFRAFWFAWFAAHPDTELIQ